VVGGIPTGFNGGDAVQMIGMLRWTYKVVIVLTLPPQIVPSV